MRGSTKHCIQNVKTLLNSHQCASTSTYQNRVNETNQKNNFIHVLSSTACSELQTTEPQNILHQSVLFQYFRFTYFLLLSPFKFGLDQDGNVYIKKWRPQQILCGLMNTLCIIRLLTEIRLGIRDLQLKAVVTPVVYFENVMNFFSFLYKAATMKAFWFNQNYYAAVVRFSVNVVKCFSLNQVKRRYYMMPWVISSILALYVAQCIVDLVAGKMVITDGSKWTPELWVAGMVKLARYTFWMDQSLQRDRISNNFTNLILSPWDGVLGALMTLGMFQRFVQGFYCDFCIFSCALTLWLHANAFAQRIVNYPKISETSLSKEIKGNATSWDKVYEHFQNIQELSRTINKAVGTQVTLYIAESVMYYSLNLNAVISSSNVFKRIDMLFFYTLTFATSIFAADVGNQMESLKSWITYGNNRFKIPSEEMNIVLHEMLAKDIGIRGSNVFTITYPFLAALLSTTVTIFVISVQSSDKAS